MESFDDFLVVSETSFVFCKTIPLRTLQIPQEVRIGEDGDFWLVSGWDFDVLCGFSLYQRVF